MGKWIDGGWAFHGREVGEPIATVIPIAVAVAAPDLLAACKGALAHHQIRCDLANRMGVQAPTAESWVDAACDAIARAKIIVNEGPTPEQVSCNAGGGTTMETAQANCRIIAASPAFVEAWPMVPEDIRERVLSALPEWVAAAIARATA